jgi:hypothetical protein
MISRSAIVTDAASEAQPFRCMIRAKFARRAIAYIPRRAPDGFA